MSRLAVEDERLKALLKNAHCGSAGRASGLLQDAVAVALEDVGMTRAIAEGEQTPHVTRADVFSSLDGGE